MLVSAKKLEIYETKDGKRPFEDWLNSIKDSRTQARIEVRLSRVALGNFGDCKSIGAGIFELRLHFGSGYRVYVGQDGDTLVILLSGGDKRSQESDIATAQKLWGEYNADRTVS